MSSNTTSTVSRRVVLTAGAASTLALTFGSTAVAADSQHPKRHFRFGSFNIHHGADADQTVDFERIARIIERLRLDAVGLQEVDRFFARSDFVDQPAWFADRLNMSAVFGANLVDAPQGPGRPNAEFGTAILSKAPIIEWENTLLPRKGDHEQRGLLRARIPAGHGEMDFYTTHLQHDDTAEREQQARTIVELARDRREPCILTGDLNDEPGSSTHEILADEFDDAWLKAGRGDENTFPVESPTKRIDYIWSRGVRPVSVRVDHHDPTASDHLPVAGRFVLKRRG